MEPTWKSSNGRVTLYCGDCLESLKELPDESVHCCVTSPPYWGLRDYGVEGQLGLEKTPEEYVVKMVKVFREVRRVLRDDGTLWLNLGDSYSGSGMGAANYPESASKKQLSNQGSTTSKGRGKYVAPGLKPKDLCGIPWRVAFALQADGWYLRQDIIWSKPNPMPESVTDRCTKAHEYIFLLAKSRKYYYDAEAIKEEADTPMDSKAKCGFVSVSGKCDTMEYSHSNETGKRWNKTETRNKRSVWTITTKPFKDAHFAVFPEAIPTTCILAGCPEQGTVLDPFAGAGTTGLAAIKQRRNTVLCELNAGYCDIIRTRLEPECQQQQLKL